MTQPRVSIILPVYNGADYLSQAIEGCLAQTCDNFELIVVDDCSTDNSLDVANSYALMDSRVNVVQHNQNKKLPAALNSGFAVATGQFFTWTSHDNFHKKEAIARLLDYLDNHPLVSIVYSDFYLVDKAGVVTGEVNLPAPDQLIYRNVVGASFLFRREVHERVGIYDENLFLSEDYDFWLRSSQHFKFGHIQEKLYYYRDHDATLTNQHFEQVFLATEKALAKFVSENKTLDRETINKIEYNLMRQSYFHQRYDKTVGYFRKNMRLAPLKTLCQLLANRHDLKILLDSYRKS
jgi:glycosyltransferase involved in cell wall biosynthesis